MNPLPTSYTEHVVVFHEGLIGVRCQPQRPSSRPMALLSNAGLLGRAGANRLNVELARALACAGIPSFRFDLSGLGDSLARTDSVPFSESMVEETRAAMDAMSDHAARFIPMGLCSGADQAFQVGVVDERVIGAVLVDGYPYITPGFRLRQLARPLRDPSAWRRMMRSGKRPSVLLRAFARRATAVGDEGMEVRDIPPIEITAAGFESMLSRGISLLVVYSAGQLGSFNGEAQFYEMHPRLRRRPELTYRYLADADHTFTLPPARRELINLIVRWWPDSPEA
ncbi:MAG: hypothetical protein ACI81R_001720 [Bradymonadia bacterium]|jgi:hypothetical protein